VVILAFRPPDEIWGKDVRQSAGQTLAFFDVKVTRRGLRMS
jgi:hypothetical protein